MPKLTDQQLLEIVQQSTESVTPEPANNLSAFIMTFGIEEGTLKIPLKLVWRLYTLWSKTKMTEELFNRELTLLMPNKQEIDGKSFYMFNASTLKITEHIYKLIKDKKKPKENSIYYKKHFESFLKSCNITKGSDWTKVSELRTTYLAWVKIKYKKNPLGMKNFEGFCRLYLEVRGLPLEVAINRKQACLTVGMKIVSPKENPSSEN